MLFLFVLLHTMLSGKTWVVMFVLVWCLARCVGVFVCSVMWFELLMTSAISCPLWSSVDECQRVDSGVFIHISGED